MTNNPWEQPPASQPPENPWQDGLAFAQADAESAVIQPGRVDTLDFLDAINQNQRNTYILILFMLLLAGSFGYVLGWGWDVTMRGTITASMNQMTKQSIPWKEIFFTFSPTGFNIGLALLSGMAVWSIFALFRADKMVLSLAGAREAPYERLPQLHNIVEEMAIAAGLPKPKIYIVPTRMPNAFATGLKPETASVGVTTGLLDTLNRRELQGVIAHEMAHILNDDMRYATVMAIMTGILIFVAQMVLNVRHFIRYGGSFSRRGGRGGHPILFAVMIVVFIVTAILVPLLARIIQMAISRQREYLADATAVRLTRDPQGLMSALQKISASNEPAQRPNAALEPLFIVTPTQMLQNGHRAWLSTHPPIEKRIERLKALE